MAHRPLRIAIASTDGRTVDQHLGRVERFFIFETSPAGSPLLGQRCLAPGTGLPGHDPRRIAEILQQIEDCSVVVASQVGPAFLVRLEKLGIRVLTSNWRVGTVLDRIARSHLFKDIKPKEQVA